jgi:hypothetical protein
MARTKAFIAVGIADSSTDIFNTIPSNPKQVNVTYNKIGKNNSLTTDTKIVSDK